jgi:hypothetical protein
MARDPHAVINTPDDDNTLTLAARGLEEPIRCFLICVPCDNHNRLLNKSIHMDS